MLSRKRAVATLLFSDLGDSFAVLLNFCNFCNFRNYCFQCFASFTNMSLARFRKYEFLSFTYVSQLEDSQGFANTSFRKLSQIGFSFRKVSQVSQGFRNVQFADGTQASSSPMGASG